MKNALFILIFIFSSLFATSGNADSIYTNGHIKSKTIKHENVYELIKYYENGQIQEVEFYNLDLEKTGTWTQYSKNGKIAAIANFKCNKKNGDWKMYNESGKMVMYIKYRNGKRDVACTINENNELAVK